MLLAGAAVRAHAATPAPRPLDLFALGAPSFTTFGLRDGLPDPVTVTLRTDDALYRAKRDGRDCVRVATAGAAPIATKRD